ncbi:3743_t:CDS:2 [Cetraspora pellucida]|uniref:3743_t:CDS:1 n=1 Tax=Cetraspora pellucida TaxID=1433469 RepID=A0ACA9KGY9_9GLOM|nr:3743_t:CDS:2 [Cetraspora pellucida]
MSNSDKDDGGGGKTNKASQIAGEIYEAASIIAIPFSKFVPIINDIVSVTDEITIIYQSAEHNKRISRVLVDRIAAVETSIRLLKIHKDDNKEFFNQENFVVMQKLSDNIQKIKKFIGEVTQLKGLTKYIHAKSIKNTFFDLTSEFDGYINTLKFAIAVDTQARTKRTESETKVIHDDLEELHQVLYFSLSFIVLYIKEISVIKNLILDSKTNQEKIQEAIDIQNKPLKLADFKETEVMRGKKVRKYIRLIDSEDVAFKLVADESDTTEVKNDIRSHIVHRDIRPENILIKANETAKIANFSLSRHFRDETRRLAVSLQTVRYSAPEMLYRNTNKYNTKCEVYSFGILLWELAEQKIPYKHLDDIMEIKNSVDKGKYREPFTNFSNLPKEYVEISKKAVGPDPDFRPTITEMFKTLEKLQANFLALRPLTPINVPSEITCEIKEIPPILLTPDDDDNIKVSEVVNFAEFNYMTMKEATLAHRVPNGNLEMAYKCFNAYAKSGNLKAKYFVGYYLYRKLVNTPYSDEEREKRAAELFKEVADSGDEVPDAQLKYGLCLFHGAGVDRSFSEAAKYFQKAANNGLPVGMYNAGNIFYAGLAGVKDEELGIKYIREAAQHNHLEAMEFCKNHKISIF